MLTIQTASWHEKYSFFTSGEELEEEELEEDDELPAHFWLRIDPPALAWRNDYENSWSLTVREADRSLHTASTWKTCDLSITQKPLTAAELLRHVLFPPPSVESVEEGGETGVCALWQHETVERDGRPVIRWYRESTQERFHVVDTIWTEPETHRIVARECRETDPITNRPVSVQVYSDYRYNEELPANAFEMPAGKPIVQRDDKGFMPEVWDTLPAQERQALQTLLHRSEIAWQNADFTAFAALWDFHVVSNVPRDTEWKERLLEQAGAGSRWKSQIEAANKQDFIPVTVAVSTYQWVKERHKVLRIKARLSVFWEDGTVWEGATDYYVRRTGRGVRIVHWEAPWEEIKSKTRF